MMAQTETRALKAAGANKNQPFTRALTQVLTRSTFMPNDQDDTGELCSYVMCLFEEAPPASDTGKMRGANDTNKVQINMLALHVQTGDIVWDSFVDDFLRRELDLRLQYLQPSEILLPNRAYGTQSKDDADQATSTTRHGDGDRDGDTMAQQGSLPISFLSAKVIESYSGTRIDTANANAVPNVSAIDRGATDGAMAHAGNHVGNHAIRIEYHDTFDYLQALVGVSAFFNANDDKVISNSTISNPNNNSNNNNNNNHSDNQQDTVSSSLAQILALPRSVITCLGVMLEYLKQFDLESSLLLVDNYHSYREASSGHSYLSLSPVVLSSMDILQTSNGSREGSLLYVAATSAIAVARSTDLCCAIYYHQ
jgi:DNA mismatch repair ATPase MutS